MLDEMSVLRTPKLKFIFIACEDERAMISRNNIALIASEDHRSHCA
jgi:hypothetical protein